MLSPRGRVDDELNQSLSRTRNISRFCFFDSPKQALRKEGGGGGNVGLKTQRRQ